jgi:bifunctional non-homologous end joining protein LigD
MPLSWQQLAAGIEPQLFTIKTVPALVANSSAWEEYCDSERPLGPAIQRIGELESA